MLVDNYQSETHLEKEGSSWPDCSAFHQGDAVVGSFRVDFLERCTIY